MTETKKAFHLILYYLNELYKADYNRELRRAIDIVENDIDLLESIIINLLDNKQVIMENNEITFVERKNEK